MRRRSATVAFGSRPPSRAQHIFAFPRGQIAPCLCASFIQNDYSAGCTQRIYVMSDAISQLDVAANAIEIIVKKKDVMAAEPVALHNAPKTRGRCWHSILMKPTRSRELRNIRFMWTRFMVTTFRTPTALNDTSIKCKLSKTRAHNVCAESNALISKQTHTNTHPSTHSHTLMQGLNHKCNGTVPHALDDRFQFAKLKFDGTTECHNMIRTSTID